MRKIYFFGLLFGVITILSTAMLQNFKSTGQSIKVTPQPTTKVFPVENCYPKNQYQLPKQTFLASNSTAKYYAVIANVKLSLPKGVDVSLIDSPEVILLFTHKSGQSCVWVKNYNESVPMQDFVPKSIAVTLKKQVWKDRLLNKKSQNNFPLEQQEKDSLLLWPEDAKALKTLGHKVNEADIQKGTSANYWRKKRENLQRIR